MRFLSFVILFLSFSASWGQDSTVVDSNAVRIYSERDILSGVKPHDLDTSYTYIHRFEKDRYTSQNLGNIGTPFRSLYYQPITSLGTRFGVDIYDAYATTGQQAKFYDSNRPISEVYYVQGSKGQQTFNFLIDRNFSKSLNIGVDLKRVTATQMVGGLNEERFSSLYDFVGTVRYKKGRYAAHFSFLRFDNTISETGGGLDSLSQEELFQFDQVVFRLSGVETYEARTGYHLFQTFDVTKKAKVYYSFDKTKQRDRYLDSDIPTNKDYYPAFYLDTNSTNENVIYDLYTNRAGVILEKKNMKQHFYAFKRSYLYDLEGQVDEWKHETFVGTQLQWGEDKKRIDVKGEYGGDELYLLNLNARYGIFKFAASASKTSPDIFITQYSANHVEWENSFNNIQHSKLSIGVEHKSKTFDIDALVSYQQLKGYTYFTDSLNPAQNNSKGNILGVTVLSKLHLNKLHLENEFNYYGINGIDELRAPDVVVRGTVYLESTMFNKALKFNIGIDAYWRTHYFPNMYSPIIHQYHVQDDFRTGVYFLGDVFINMKIKQALVFVKLANATQGLIDKGYFNTPYYSASQRTVNFGVIWRFYD